MKRFIMIAMTLMCSLVGYSQENNNVMIKTIPEKLKIQDKIIVQNKSPYLIQQMVVALQEGNQMVPLGSIAYLGANDEVEMESFKSNALKQLRGQKIAIKVKGIKMLEGNSNSTSIGGGSFITGGFGINIKHKDIDASRYDNIDPSLITYDFDVMIFEADHDLYLKVVFKGDQGSNIMDF